MADKVEMLPNLHYFRMMKKYVHSVEVLQNAGFPLVESGELKVVDTNYFGSSSVTEQKCRCGKTVSLLDRKWYCASECYYHPLKADKENYWKYKCCGGSSKSLGCALSRFHTCSYIDLDGDWYQTKYISLGKNREYPNIYAMDCEFIFTKVGMEVARVSLVSLYEGVVYDTFVTPRKRVLDYNTQFSGVTRDDLKGENVKDLSRVRADLRQFLSSESILIGHGLHSDLKGLHLCHKNIIDTSLIYPHFKGFPYRYSLEYLAREHLGIAIHEDYGHNSIEDATICLQLVAVKCGLARRK